MMRNMFGAVGLLAVAALPAEGTVLGGIGAGVPGAGWVDVQGYGGYGQSVPGDAIGISANATQAVVAALKRGAAQCQQSTDPGLALDCLAYEYWLTAQSMPQEGGYAQARAALLKGAERLHALAASHAATNRPAKVMRLGGRKTTRAITPVADPAKLADKAAAIIEDTKLILLRSASGSDERRIAYQQVAAIVDSTKVLLRSS